ncbi:MAG: glutamate mutase L [Chloroflexota bacterium]
MADSTIQSILAVECGNVTTAAVLIERVEGHYRLASSGQTASTYGRPEQDITLGVFRAVRQIEQDTGRTLLAPGGWPITPQGNRQQGVDAFVVVSSAGPALQLVLAGLMQEVTLASARRAAAATYTAITNVLSLENNPQTNETSPGQKHSAEARIQAIQTSQPDVILLVGGTDDGAERPVIDLANALAMALRVLPQPDPPHILYAGNRALRAQVVDILGPVTSVHSVDNIRPRLDIENLAMAQLELEKLYLQRKMLQLPGFQKLSNWCKYPVLPASKSFEKLISYLGRHNHLNVIGVNVGSAATAISTQAGDYQGTTVRSDAGVGYSMPALLKAVPLAKIERWLPFIMTPEELHNRLLNKSLHPASLPSTYEELMIEHAIARESLRLVLDQARSSWPTQSATGRGDIRWNLVIGAGRTLTRTPKPGQAALMLLDGVEPWGVTSLALDVSGMTNMLAAMAVAEPIAAVEVAARDTFLNLGTVIAPLGRGFIGQPALKVKLSQLEGPGSSKSDFEADIPFGSIEVFPLSPGQKATLEIRPARHFDIGLGQPGRGAVTEVEGGILGVIFDTRGRPLRLPPDEAQRRDLIEQWLVKLDTVHATT